jgi:hypothetical protein
MAYERLIKRTIYVAKCKCGEWEDVLANNPPRERQCPKCREFVPYTEQSAVGPDLEKK